MAKQIKLLTYAKVNLYLEVLRRRPDGYHDIESVMQTVSLADEILLEEAQSGIEVVCDSPGVPTGKENLAAKAWSAFFAATGKPPGVRITITKRIPVAAGLGGGSGNAAGVLLGLARMYGGNADLHRLAADIGSDVPFFLDGGTQLAKGRGTDLEPQKPVADCWIVLVCPDTSISTAWAYEHLKMPLTRGKDLTTMIQLGLSRGDVPAVARELFNRFESVVFEVYPDLGSLKAEIREHHALGVVLSGSGPSLLAIFDLQNTAAMLNRWLTARGYRSFMVRPVKKGVEIL
ncbi:MAG: 4-(cytidine 5'-diphospho)-2-C-methyl-D-erythritol kinase [Candidatus Eisenbacteria sp.]|nr:4-(cytidine 5'-diphospho)-2-C-methyl-D-erythritol kinase [Candidatus Eisenbacteria bacterium]